MRLPPRFDDNNGFDRKEHLLITNVSLMTLYVADPDAARDLYVNKGGFEPGPTSPWESASDG